MTILIAALLNESLEALSCRCNDQTSNHVPIYLSEYITHKKRSIAEDVKAPNNKMILENGLQNTMKI